MGLIDFNVDSQNMKEADSYKEKAKQWTRRHKKISMVSGIIILALLFFNVIPTGFLALLPFNIGKYLVMIIIAEIPSYYAARWIKKRVWTRPIDDIYECNIADEQEEKHFIYREGLLREEYEFFPHEPITWTNHKGNRVYKLLKIDKQEKKAYTSFFGDLNPHALQRKKENWAKQQAWNKSVKEKSSEIAMMLDDITEQASYEVTNRLYRKGYKATHPEVADDVIDSIDSIGDSKDETKEKDMIEALRDKIGINDRESILELPQSDSNEQ